MARAALFRDASILPALEGSSAAELAEKIFRHYYRLLEAEDIRGAYEFGAKTLSGLKVSEIALLVSDVIADEGETIGKTLLFGRTIAKGLRARPAIIELIRDLQKIDVAIWVVSASPRPLVAEAIKHFGISAELIGIRQKIDNEVITPELEYPLSVIDGKVNCIKLFIDPSKKPLLGVGDSGNDLPMLEYSCLKAVVDRGNSLSRKAAAEGWFVVGLPAADRKRPSLSIEKLFYFHAFRRSHFRLR